MSVVRWFHISLCCFNSKKSGKVKSAYKREYLNVGCDVDFDFAGPTIHGAAVTGYEGWLAGYQMTFDSAKSKMTRSNFAIGYKTEDFQLHTNVWVVCSLELCTFLSAVTKFSEFYCHYWSYSEWLVTIDLQCVADIIPRPCVCVAEMTVRSSAALFIRKSMISWRLQSILPGPLAITAHALASLLNTCWTPAHLLVWVFTALHLDTLKTYHCF